MMKIKVKSLILSELEYFLNLIGEEVIIDIEYGNGMAHVIYRYNNEEEGSTNSTNNSSGTDDGGVGLEFLDWYKDFFIDNNTIVGGKIIDGRVYSKMESNSKYWIAEFITKDITINGDVFFEIYTNTGSITGNNSNPIIESISSNVKRYTLIAYSQQGEPIKAKITLNSFTTLSGIGEAPYNTFEIKK